MPIIWRYLLNQYFKIFFLTTTTFIGILLVTRLKEIAKFASLGPESLYILKFIFYLIPYILPITIPVASLIAAILVTRNLSTTHEITSMRSLGFSISQLLFPLLLVGAIFSVLNFYIVSELTTFSHLSSRKLIHQITSVNPLFLLQNRQLLKQRDLYVDLDNLDKGRIAENVFIIVLNQKNNRLNLLNAKQLELQGSNILGTDMGIISNIESTKDDADHLLIENEQAMQINAEELSSLMKKSGFRLNTDYFQLGQLLVRTQEFKERLHQKKTHYPGHHEIIGLKKQINRCVSEIFRRFSAAVSVFTFTLLGLSFGLGIGRGHGNKAVYYVVGLSVLSLIAFFGAKSFDQNLPLSITLYTLPHAIIIFFSILRLKKIAKGIE